MAPPPLAGKPPFATDLPDSYYESGAPAPQRRVRQAAPANPNDRSSAYDVYNNYLPAGDRDAAGSRQSGVGALGMGLLNMEDSDDDDDDARPGSSPSKHAALAAATANPSRHSPSPPNVIAAPQPGYAAPIAALNLAQPEPAAAPSRDRSPPMRNPFDTGAPSLRNPFADPHPRPPNISTSPTPSMVSNEPHPLQPPITPITPVFARPTKPGITFAEDTATARPRKPIMRSDKEGEVLPSRGEKGDDFWRRFSMVAKEENRKPNQEKTSLWLRKTQSGTTRLSRWVWIVGLVLLAIIGGAIGLGLFLNRGSPAHQPPKTFGGSANEAATGVQTSTVKVDEGGSTIKHVSPTYTLKRDILFEARATATPLAHVVRMHKRRHHDH